MSTSSTTALCRTLSSKVGIPIGRVFDPSPFGMCTRFTGGATYVPAFRRSCSDARFPSRFAAYSCAVWWSTPTAPSSPSLHRVPLARFPCFTGTTGGSDLLPLVPTSLLCSLAGTAGFLPPTGTAGSPRFLGVPLCGRCAHRPRPDLGTSRCGALVLPSPQTKALAPANKFVSSLQRAAPALPVYASRAGSPPHHARFGSRLVASLCRAGFVLLGPTEGFSQLHDILLLQASPGAPSG